MGSMCYMISYLVCWLLCLCPHMVLSEPDKVCFDDERQSHVGFCGPTLSSLLQTLCVSGYNKRSVDSQVTRAKRLETLHEDIFIPAQKALGFLTHKRANSWDQSAVQGYNSGNIVCECCYHRCGIGELMQYCSESGSSPIDFGFKKRMFLPAHAMPHNALHPEAELEKEMTFNDMEPEYVLPEIENSAYGGRREDDRETNRVDNVRGSQIVRKFKYHPMVRQNKLDANRWFRSVV